MEFWFSVPKDDKSQHGSTVEYPHCEAEEVNETLDTAGEDHADGHQGMEEDGGGGGHLLDVYEGENVHQVTFSTGHVAQPTGCEDRPVGGSEGGAGHGERHEPGHDAQDPVTERHGHGVTDQHLPRRHDGEVGDVDQDVDDGHHGNSDSN